MKLTFSANAPCPPLPPSQPNVHNIPVDLSKFGTLDTR
jgi:hypothetical protein